MPIVYKVCIFHVSMFLGKITFSEFEILTNPEMFEQIKSYLGQLEGKKSSLKSRQSFSAFLDPLVDERRREFFEKLHQRYKSYSGLIDWKES